MNAVDTNVLIYRLDHKEPAKQARAKVLLQRLRRNRSTTVTIWQVITETARWLRAQQLSGHFTSTQVRNYLRGFRQFFPISMPTQVILDRALDLADAHSLSHWDSMLVAACLEAGVDTLFTEDMGAPRLIESLRLENPFI